MLTRSKKSGLMTHKLEDEGLWYFCNQCDDKMLTVETLRLHIRKEHPAYAAALDMIAEDLDPTEQAKHDKRMRLR